MRITGAQLRRVRDECSGPIAPRMREVLARFPAGWPEVSHLRNLVEELAQRETFWDLLPGVLRESARQDNAENEKAKQEGRIFAAAFRRGCAYTYYEVAELTETMTHKKETETHGNA